MSVPALRELLRGLVSELVVQEGSPCLATDIAASHMLLALDQGAWGAESKAVLDRVVLKYSHRLTPRIILGLLPSNTTTLCLKACRLLTEVCMNEIIERCPYLQSLDLAENSDINFSQIHLFQKDENRKIHQSLAHLSLEDCDVSDKVIHALLTNAPMLQSLNIARCHITDKVFLLNETKQLAREGGFQHSSLKHGYDSQLQSIDVTGCNQFSSTGVRHLCTLCGPTLRVLKLSWTKIDSIALMYLCGLGLPAVVQFYLSLEEGKSEPQPTRRSGGSKGVKNRREALVETLTQFEQIAAQVREETEQSTHGEGSHSNLLIEPNDHVDQELNPNTAGILLLDSSSSLPENQNSLDTIKNLAFSYSCVDSGCETALDINESSGNFTSSQVLHELSDESAPLIHSTHFPICSEKDSANAGGAVSSDSCLQSDANNFPSVPVQNTSNISTHPLQTKEVTDTPLSSTEKSEHSQTKSHSESPSLKPGTHSTSRTPAINVAVSGHTHSSVPFFTSNIRELCVSGTVFADAPASHFCLRRFLMANPDLSTLCLMGGLNGQSVTDEVLTQVAETCSGLKHLSVEGCVHLTTAGVAGLVACTKLEHLDLTGVAFIENAGLVYLVRSLSLTSLLIAETRIKNQGLKTIASQANSHQLEELDLSWCEDLEDDQGLNAVASSCHGLRRLILRECVLSHKTIGLIAENCHNITELSIACCDISVIGDDDVILLSQNLAALQTIDLSWNTNLTNAAVHALLSNCRHLITANLSGLKRITAAPFAGLIAVPEELSEFVAMKQKELESTFTLALALSDLPCLPHRSTFYATQLSDLQLQYSDFVQDHVLSNIVAITLGSIKILDYYGSEVTASEGVVEKFVKDLILDRGDVL
ncbi:F-box/lrr-repeat protein 2-like [Plakobranchus ocellatus]|uniref:F-box/lrr-repeat protein 2-like n=1 Tax=Plakobranchus ocellatus TaxID=259542 RepID=A0AAV3YGZ2_9GAST|nr:F-box/lrr-repeat protein 2-like [Plakobranchus ocellatus]